MPETEAEHPALDSFLEHYIRTALWSETNPDTGEPFDDDADAADNLDDELRVELKAQCAAFLREFALRIAEIDHNVLHHVDNYSDDPELTQNLAMAAHDLWLSANEHGAGFLDGHWPQPLASAMDTFAGMEVGRTTLYVGDDGKIYAM